MTFDFSGLPKYEARVRDAAAAGLTRAAIRLQAEMKNVQQRTPRTGKRDPKHVRSQPGTPPARQDGTLINRIAHNGASAANLVARAGTNLRYGRWLEFGTGTMAPRPWVFVALQKARPKLTEDFKTAARAALRSGGAKP